MLSTVLVLLAAPGALPPHRASLPEGHTITERGQLDESDPKISSGEYLDQLTIEVRQAGPVTVRLTSKFDGYLIVQPPGWADTREGQLENDDWNGDLTESRIVIENAQVGTWTVGVTAANAGVGGAYRLDVDLPGANPSAVRRQTEQGQLSALDPVLTGGEYNDRYQITLAVGDRLVARMNSKAFDTYLALLGLEGESLLQNDDSEGLATNSRLEYVAEVAGIYTVLATSAQARVTGPYELHLEAYPAEISEDVADGETRRGTLAKGDEVLDSGAFADVLDFTAPAGQVLVVALRSEEFDTLLIVMNSSAATLDMNDDFEGQTNHSQVVIEVPADGRYTVGATSYGPATGSYEVTVSRAPEGVAPAPAPAPDEVGERVERGRLELSDEAMNTGEYVDEHAVELFAGQRVEFLLESTAFDPYLVVVPADGEPVQVDDVGGSLNPQLTYTSRDGETLRVLVTSSRPESTGDYALTIRTSGGAEDEGEFWLLGGELDTSDPQLSGGEYLERHEVELTAGAEYSCLLVSSEFDAYLGIRDPEGETLEDDDSGGDGDALLTYTAPVAGTYRFTVTSSGPGELGDYSLLIAPSSDTPVTSAAPPTPAAQAEAAGNVSTLFLDTAYGGDLEEGDAMLENGEFHDVWAFDAEAGETYHFELFSEEFDTYIVLIDGDQNVLQNDDLAGERSKSGIEWTADSDGQVMVLATSYRAAEAGGYVLSCSSMSSASLMSGATSKAGDVYGLFIGISDYPGDDQDLPLCDEDAVRLRAELMAHTGMSAENSVLLINREARKENVVQAIRDLSSRVGEGDTFVVFYSGHGTRVKRSTLVERDPDGHDSLDEALVLHDELLLDDELDVLLRGASAGTSLIVLDSCFSGGFSKDVISQPGRMGLFSSHEDVTSATAAKFKAGGYLAAFASDALGKDQAIADTDGDGQLSASELSQYIYESYRNELVRSKSSDFLDVGDNLGFQQLIVDRGGVSVKHPLFRIY